MNKVNTKLIKILSLSTLAIGSVVGVGVGLTSCGSPTTDATTDATIKSAIASADGKSINLTLKKAGKIDNPDNLKLQIMLGTAKTNIAFIYDSSLNKINLDNKNFAGLLPYSKVTVSYNKENSIPVDCSPVKIPAAENVTITEQDNGVLDFSTMEANKYYNITIYYEGQLTSLNSEISITLPNPQNILSLNIENFINYQGDKETINRLIKNLFNNLSNLYHLDLGSYVGGRIKDTDFGVFDKCFDNLTNLNWFKMGNWGRSITAAGGFNMIMSSLSKLTNLNYLDFYGCCALAATNLELKPMGKALFYLTKLKEINLGYLGFNISNSDNFKPLYEYFTSVKNKIDGYKPFNGSTQINTAFKTENIGKPGADNINWKN